jgi:CRISPR/Cas system CMR subunit Cmr6 (Cas7 group RAMP superfamily)
MEGERKTKPKKFRELNEEERKKLIDGAKKKYLIFNIEMLMGSLSSLSATPSAKFTKTCLSLDTLWHHWIK